MRLAPAARLKRLRPVGEQEPWMPEPAVEDQQRPPAVALGRRFAPSSERLPQPRALPRRTHRPRLPGQSRMEMERMRPGKSILSAPHGLC